MSDWKVGKTFLKWVGGKRQIIDKILSKFPNEMNNYHELFLGGGSVLLSVLLLKKQNKITIKDKIYAYDINKDLINVYKHIQSEKDTLFERITHYINEYDSLNGTVINRKPKNIDEAKTSKESYYYWIRNKYNNIEKGTVECSALFMFINKTCFRGMYREGPNGYNVPYGHYKTTPTIITESDLNFVSELIKDVEFKHSSFADSIKEITEGDFVYLDPPYVPVEIDCKSKQKEKKKSKSNKSFVGYVAAGFDLDCHNLLFSEIKKLQNVKFVLSNSNEKLVTDSFKNYHIEEIIARRAINSKNPAAKAKEVIIYN